MASVRGILNIQSLNELTYENCTYSTYSRGCGTCTRGSPVAVHGVLEVFVLLS